MTALKEPLAVTNIGPLAIEGHQPDGAGEQGNTPGGATYRPVGTYLQNDGRVTYWMLPGETYRLARDDRGWVVTCKTWPPGGHTYRLARDGEPADGLPLADGRTVRLHPHHVYEIVAGHGRPGLWALWEVLL